MKKTVLSFVFAFVSITTFAQSGWSVDPLHSSVNFNIKHMGVSFVQGRFDKFEGTAATNKANDLEGLQFTVIVETVNTGVDMRDKHLRSADFFEVEKFPTMNFQSVSLVKGKNNTYTLKGKLKIKDVSKEVSIPLTYGGVTKNQQGKEVLGLQAKFTVNRLDYNIKYDPTGAGVAKDVEVSVFLEFVKE